MDLNGYKEVKDQGKPFRLGIKTCVNIKTTSSRGVASYLYGLMNRVYACTCMLGMVVRTKKKAREVQLFKQHGHH